MNFTFYLNQILNQAALQLLKAAGSAKSLGISWRNGCRKNNFYPCSLPTLGVTSAIGSPTYSIINEYTSSPAGHDLSYGLVPVKR